MKAIIYQASYAKNYDPFLIVLINSGSIGIFDVTNNLFNEYYLDIKPIKKMKKCRVGNQRGIILQLEPSERKFFFLLNKHIQEFKLNGIMPYVIL